LKEVIDTRFFIEYFYSTQPEIKKKTTSKLKELIAKNEGLLPTIAMAEIIQITCEKGGKDTAESRYQALAQSGLQIQNLTPNVAKQAGLLRCKYQNVPMDDCIIVAKAIENHARILSDDPHFGKMFGGRGGIRTRGLHDANVAIIPS
jgi:predicted nucleic acid-binding protein